MEEISKQLLEEFMKVYSTAKDFANEQVPDVIMQAVKWSFTQDVLWLCVAIFLLTSATIILIFFIKKLELDADKHSCVDVAEEEFLAKVTVIGAGYIIGTIMFIYNVLQILQYFVAPKVYLLNVVKHLIK